TPCEGAGLPRRASIASGDVPGIRGEAFGAPSRATFHVPAAHGQQGSRDLRRKLRFRGSQESRTSVTRNRSRGPTLSSRSLRGEERARYIVPLQEKPKNQPREAGLATTREWLRFPRCGVQDSGIWAAES